MSDSGFDALPYSLETRQIQIPDISEELYEAFASCPSNIVTDSVLQVQREKSISLGQFKSRFFDNILPTS